MNITDFADKYRLEARRNADDDGDLTINGRTGQIYTCTDKELGILFMPGLDKNDRAISALSGVSSNHRKSGKRKLSAAARASIAKAQRERWRKVKAAKKG